jgi:hypothetical protein
MPKITLSTAHAAFMEGGRSITVAVRDGDRTPWGTIACAASVRPGENRLTLYVYEDAGEELLEYLETQPQIAILFEQPTTHRGCQAKGEFLGARGARDDERALIERQVDGFANELEAIGIPRALTGGWRIWPCRALDVRVDELFEQTPGPGAGEPLA